MTKNVTLRLATALLRDAEHAAVEEGLSLSGWLAKRLEQWAGGNARRHYDRAKRSALSRLDHGMNLGGTAPSRDTLHDRRNLC